MGLWKHKHHDDWWRWTKNLNQSYFKLGYAKNWLSLTRRLTNHYCAGLDPAIKFLLHIIFSYYILNAIKYLPRILRTASPGSVWNDEPRKTFIIFINVNLSFRGENIFTNVFHNSEWVELRIKYHPLLLKNKKMYSDGSKNWKIRILNFYTTNKNIFSLISLCKGTERNFYFKRKFKICCLCHSSSRFNILQFKSRVLQIK